MTGVIGIDEVGRGPLAGPVTVCACYIEDTQEVEKVIFSNTIRDSKKLTKTFRNNIFKTIRQNRKIKSSVKYAITSRSATYIDKYGIVRAIHACIQSCLEKLHKQGIQTNKVQIRLDGGLTIKHMQVDQSTHVRGDEKFVEIALASVLAKVHRDTYMERLAQKVDGYKWEENVGYGTKFHREAIKIKGITKYHRTTYLKGFKLFEKAE